METHIWTTLIAIFALCFSSAKSQCSIATDLDFGSNSPLLITNGAFVYPPRRNSKILSFTQNQVQQAYCPGTSVVVQGTSTRSNKIALTCVSAKQFNAPTNPTPFNAIRCTRDPPAVLLSRGACNNGNLANIGFQVDRYVSLIDLCFNSNRGTATWAHAVINGAIAGRQTTASRITFRTGTFFKDVPVNRAYTRASQRQMLLSILGQNQTLVDKYIPATGLHYLARGHLIARADMFYTAQQLATFYYINVLPMWQSINAGNWFLVEERVRGLAINNGDIDIWVGGLYRLEVQYTPDERRQIYLSQNSLSSRPAIFVPRLLFKVAYHRPSNRAMVYITVNDPYMTSTNPLPNGYQACREYAACRQSETRFDNIDRGFTYCCLWSDFIQNGEASTLDLPDLGNPAALV